MTVTKNLFGKIVIKGIIHTLTGLHIGAGRESIEIGALDNPVLIEPVTKQPYIPGSSIKGKMRSLLERRVAKEKNPENPAKFFNRSVGRDVRIHVCETKEYAYNCPVCRLFGSSGGREASGSNFPSRLKFRDAYFTPYTDKWLLEADTDLLYTEIKNENVLDRITSAATPRPVERVPRDADFIFEVVYDVEDLQQLKEDLENLLFSLAILEDDYLGGNGSRGYGKIKFYFTNIIAKKADFYKGAKTETKEFGIAPNTDILSKNQRPDYETLMSVDDIRDKLQEIVNYFSS